MPKISGLTRNNVDALRETHTTAIQSGDLVLTATTAEWPNGSARHALTKLNMTMATLPTKGHPRASLHAVRRKLLHKLSVEEQPSTSAMSPADVVLLETNQADDESVVPANTEEEVDAADLEDVRPMRPAAEFLLDLLPENLFEPMSAAPGSTKYRCKGCGEENISRGAQAAHYAAHRAHRAQTKEEKKMATATKAKPKKETAKDQGVPDIYLNKETGNFKPGLDARYKSDLVNSALGLTDKNALAVFKPEDAVKRLQKRGWTKYLDIKKRVLTEQAAKKEQAQKEKAAKVKEQAASKKSGSTKAEAKPDPKPKSAAKKKTGSFRRSSK